MTTGQASVDHQRGVLNLAPLHLVDRKGLDRKGAGAKGPGGRGYPALVPETRDLRFAVLAPAPVKAVAPHDLAKAAVDQAMVVSVVQAVVDRVRVTNRVQARETVIEAKVVPPKIGSESGDSPIA